MTERPRVVYAREPGLAVAEFQRVLVKSGLGAIRPVDDEPRLKEMLSGANLILTARLDQAGHPLVGVARCITDFAWCCYLAGPRALASAKDCSTRRAARSGRASV